MKTTHGITRRAFVGGTALAAALGLAACKSEGASDGGSGSDGQSDGTLSLSVVGLSCIDPYNVQDDTDISVCRQVFDPLMTYDFKKDEVVPWPPSPSRPTATAPSSPSRSARAPRSTTATRWTPPPSSAAETAS